MPLLAHRVRASVVVAYVAFVLTGASASVGSVVLPAQIADYDVERATIGLTFFTFSAGFVLAGAVTGWLMERFGTRLALVAGSVTYVAAALLMAAAVVRGPRGGTAAIFLTVARSPRCWGSSSAFWRGVVARMRNRDLLAHAD